MLQQPFTISILSYEGKVLMMAVVAFPRGSSAKPIKSDGVCSARKVLLTPEAHDNR
jgi:hypothetical protein